MAYFPITGSFILRSGNKSIFIELKCTHLIMIEWCLFAMFRLQNLLIFLTTSVDMLCDLHSKVERPCFRIRSSLFRYVFEERTNKSNRDPQLRGQNPVSGCFVFIVREYV